MPALSGRQWYATVLWEVHKGAQRFVVFMHSCGWESVWTPVERGTRSLVCPRCRPDHPHKLTPRQHHVIDQFNMQGSKL